MTEVVTYLRVNINEKWTNLGIVAEEDEIQEHFDFVEDLLKQKQRTDELEKRWHKMKAILDGVWKYGNADEHEIAYDLLNRMQQLEENNNARSK